MFSFVYNCFYFSRAINAQFCTNFTVYFSLKCFVWNQVQFACWNLVPVPLLLFIIPSIDKLSDNNNKNSFEKKNKEVNCVVKRSLSVCVCARLCVSFYRGKKKICVSTINCLYFARTFASFSFTLSLVSFLSLNNWNHVKI